MKNPWLELPKYEPFVLKDDAPYIEKHNNTCAEICRYNTSLLPDPFVGLPSAAVYLLMGTSKNYPY